MYDELIIFATYCNNKKDLDDYHIKLMNAKLIIIIIILYI
jgi:hypothetical protein